MLLSWVASCEKEEEISITIDSTYLPSLFHTNLFDFPFAQASRHYQAPAVYVMNVIPLKKPLEDCVFNGY